MKVLGALVLLALLGVAVEVQTTNAQWHRYSGYVADFIPPSAAHHDSTSLLIEISDAGPHLGERHWVSMDLNTFNSDFSTGAWRESPAVSFLFNGHDSAQYVPPSSSF